MDMQLKNATQEPERRISKIYNIEFLRIIGCLAVICLHFFHHATFHKQFAECNIYNKLYDVTTNGQKAVDLFFILSGIFFVLTVDKTKSVFQFVKKKIFRLWPTMLFAMLLAYIFSAFKIIKFQTFNNILAILGLNGTGLVLQQGNLLVFWYVSAMVWTLTLLFYIIKCFYKKYINLIISLTIFFCYSFIIHAQNGKIWDNTRTFGCVFNVGMMRAFGGIGIGYFIGEWYKNNYEMIVQYVPSFIMKIFITALEALSLGFIIKYLLLKNISYKNDIIFIVFFSVIVVTFLAKKGYISSFLNKKGWNSLSKYTFACYMTHSVLLQTLRNSFFINHSTFVMQHPILNIIATFSLIISVGVFTYHFVEVPARKYLTKTYGE